MMYSTYPGLCGPRYRHGLIPDTVPFLFRKSRRGKVARLEPGDLELTAVACLVPELRFRVLVQQTLTVETRILLLRDNNQLKSQAFSLDVYIPLSVHNKRYSPNFDFRVPRTRRKPAFNPLPEHSIERDTTTLHEAPILL